MSERDYEINGRIFKRERYKPSTNDIVLVSNTTGDTTKNQVTLSWASRGLEKEYQLVACKVMLNEWAQRLPNYPVLRAFVRAQDSSDNIELFITFEVAEHLESSEIRLVMTHATVSMGNCLNKVTERTITETNSFTLLDEEQREPVEVNLLKDKLLSQSLIIDKLNKETERKDQMLENALKQKKANDPIRPTTSMTEQLEYLEAEIKNKNAQIELMRDKALSYATTNDKLVAGQRQWEMTLENVQKEYHGKLTELEQLLRKQEAYQEMLIRQRDGFEQQLLKSEALNRELDKANVLLTTRVSELQVDHQRLEKVAELERETSSLKERLSEELGNKKRIEMANKALEEALERLEVKQHHLVEKVQSDYNTLENSLKESEKKALLEATNKHQARHEKQEIENRYEKEKEKRVSLEADRDYLEIQLQEKEMILSQSDEQKSFLERLVTTLEDELEKLREEQAMMSYHMSEVAASAQEEENKQNAEYLQLDETIRQLTQANKVAEQRIESLLTQMPEQEVSTELIASTTFDSERQENEHTETWALSHDKEEAIYESDPFKTEVEIEELTQSILDTRKEEEDDIIHLFDIAETAGFKQVRLTTKQFKECVSELRFLNFRWNQIYELDSIDHKQGFLKWCLPYIEDVENFQEILDEDVKASLFSRKSVTMGEDTLLLLEAYSALSVYLDTYYLKVSSYIDKYFINEENQ